MNINEKLNEENLQFTYTSNTKYLQITYNINDKNRTITEQISEAANDVGSGSPMRTLYAPT